ncbi:MAG: hypothetical protein AAGB01_10160 [Cyanobacteria bacterium P01_F01_bin.42]
MLPVDRVVEVITDIKKQIAAEPAGNTIVDLAIEKGSFETLVAAF